MTLHFNYGIEDTVKFIKEPSLRYADYRCKHDDFKNIIGKEYKINGYGWFIDKDNKLSQYYRVEAYSDNFLNYHNQITEDCFEVVGDRHPFDENISEMMKSHDNQTLKLGQKVYASIYYGSREEPYINENFTFACYGTIVGFHRFREEKWNNSMEVSISREFLCTDKNGREWTDARKDANISTYHPSGILVNVGEEFAQEYIDRIFKKRNSKILLEDSYDYFEVHAWLTHMGIWDKVMELYKKRKSGKKSSNKKK